MQTLEVTITINADGTTTLVPQLQLPPGTHHGVLVIEAPPAPAQTRLDLRMLDWGATQSTFRREDLYGDDGR